MALMNKGTGQTISQFCEHVKTNELQNAELQGICAAIQLTKEIFQAIITIACDCKNAIK